MSYLTLMRRLKMHPDLGGDHARAALINEAFATLVDPVRRAAYDRVLARERVLPGYRRDAVHRQDVEPVVSGSGVIDPCGCAFCGAAVAPGGHTPPAAPSVGPMRPVRSARARCTPQPATRTSRAADAHWSGRRAGCP